jgi:deoxyribonuclease V
MGIATHLGIILDIPSIGCAKSRLIGEYREPAETKGRFSQLLYKGKTVGTAVRTRDRVKPVFVSPGHLIDVKEAVDIVLSCTGSTEYPNP